MHNSAISETIAMAVVIALFVLILLCAALDWAIGASERASIVGSFIGVLVFAVIVSPALIHDVRAWKRGKRGNDA